MSAGARRAHAKARRRPAHGLAGLVAAVGLLAVVVVARGGVDEPFPHERHAGLFPLCIGCHEGVPLGDPAAYYPEPGQCASCHDGIELDPVDWMPPPAREPSAIRFSHLEHIAAADGAGEPPLACERCHAPEDTQRMAIRETVVEQRCFTCHAHAAESHYVDADCAVCHDPAAATRLGGRWIAALPYPADHVTGEFLPELHGRLASAEPARCATCHTRERCSSCHVDAADRPAIARIPLAPATLELPRFAAHYHIPPSHLADDFTRTHGRIASRDTCATCHTRDDCAACHVAEPPPAAAALPAAAAVMAPGVLLRRRAPASHESAWFLTRHGALAAVGPASCTACHAPTFCSDCHDAPAVRAAAAAATVTGPRFHPENYAARHAAEAYGRRLECSSCHDVGLFCRDCHQQAGFGTVGRLGEGFHDAEPVWLLRHGQAARQALESCATCHGQRDCLQCHSTIGAFRVNPHGPGFDPEPARRRNPAICFACHVTAPGG